MFIVSFLLQILWPKMIESIVDLCTRRENKLTLGIDILVYPSQQHFSILKVQETTIKLSLITSFFSLR
jgi:hypothetical protein